MRLSKIPYVRLPSAPPEKLIRAGSSVRTSLNMAHVTLPPRAACGGTVVAGELVTVSGPTVTFLLVLTPVTVFFSVVVDLALDDDPPAFDAVVVGCPLTAVDAVVVGVPSLGAVVTVVDDSLVTVFPVLELVFFPPPPHAAATNATAEKAMTAER